MPSNCISATLSLQARDEIMDAIATALAQLQADFDDTLAAVGSDSRTGRLLLEG